MSDSKRATIKATLSQGLVSANKGNPFWSKADAMKAFNLFHNNATNKGE